MIRCLADVAYGSAAAIRSARWIQGTRLRTLMVGDGAHRPRPGDAGLAVATSRLALRLLGRLPFLPWRNTCLYRSVAECLVLRHYGIACRVQLGVETDSAAPAGINAHAWVERGDRQSGSLSHTLLRPSS